MKIIILGATSGLGRGTAELFAQAGHQVGIAGRRVERLKESADKYPNQMIYSEMDVIDPDVTTKLSELIEKLGGLDLFLYSSGVGKENFDLDYGIESWTNDVNINGFTKTICFVYNYFRVQGFGHMAVISSIAGFRGIGGSSSYSASKAYQRIYFEAIAQGSKSKNKKITYTTIIPGFVDTEIIAGRNYPLTLSCDKASSIMYKGLICKQRYIYVDFKWRFIAAFMRIIPNWLWERMPVK